MSDQRTILIADDDAKVRELSSDMLRVAGYRVLVARTGLEALARAASADLLILDLAMPGVTGVDVLIELRARDATATLPIILMTGLDDTPDLRSMAQGYDIAAVLIKPVSPRVLVEQVYAVLHPPTDGGS